MQLKFHQNPNWSIQPWTSLNEIQFDANVWHGLPAATVPSGLGVGTFSNTSSQDFDKIEAAGCGFVRLGLPWYAVEQTTKGAVRLFLF